MLAVQRRESRFFGVRCMDLVRIVAVLAVVSAYVWAALGVFCQDAELIALGATVGALGAFFIVLSILCGE